MPILYRNTLTIDGLKVIDGGVADSIPVYETVRRGVNKILVLRSRPAEYVKKHKLLALLFMKLVYFRQQALQKTFKCRPDVYMNAVRFVSNPPDGTMIRQLTPPESIRLERNTTDLDILEEAYQHGRTAGKRFAAEYAPN